jgi:DNA-binding HxlR family transcriptional regulator
MPTHIRHGRSPCPVARSLDVLGDKWTLLIIREALSGTTRFMDFSHQLPGLARTLLSQRLKRLIALGVFETIPVSQAGHYHEYVLTAMGRELFSGGGGAAAVGRRLPLRRLRTAAMPGRSAHRDAGRAGGCAVRLMASHSRPKTRRPLFVGQTASVTRRRSAARRSEILWRATW